MWGTNPSLLGEKIWVLSSLPVVGHCVTGRVYSEIVSHSAFPIHFNVVSPLILPPWRSHPPSFQDFLFYFVLFSEEIISYTAVSFGVSTGGGEFKILLYCHLEPEWTVSFYLQDNSFPLYINIPQLIYPFTCGWTLALFLYLGYYK